MALREYEKDPGAILDYSIDWSGAAADGGPWLAAGETISASTWTIAPAVPLTGLLKASDTFTTTVATIWLTGGVAETIYLVTNQIVTSLARTDRRSISIRVIAR